MGLEVLMPIPHREELARKLHDALVNASYIPMPGYFATDGSVRRMWRCVADAAIAALKGPVTGEELYNDLARYMGGRPREWGDNPQVVCDAYNAVAATFSGGPASVWKALTEYLGGDAKAEVPNDIVAALKEWREEGALCPDGWAEGWTIWGLGVRSRHLPGTSTRHHLPDTEDGRIASHILAGWRPALDPFLFSTRSALDYAGAPKDKDGAPVSDGWRASWVCEALENERRAHANLGVELEQVKRERDSARASLEAASKELTAAGISACDSYAGAVRRLARERDEALRNLTAARNTIKSLEQDVAVLTSQNKSYWTDLTACRATVEDLYGRLGHAETVGREDHADAEHWRALRVRLTEPGVAASLGLGGAGGWAGR